MVISLGHMSLMKKNNRHNYILMISLVTRFRKHRFYMELFFFVDLRWSSFETTYFGNRHNVVFANGWTMTWEFGASTCGTSHISQADLQIRDDSGYFWDMFRHLNFWVQVWSLQLVIASQLTFTSRIIADACRFYADPMGVLVRRCNNSI